MARTVNDIVCNPVINFFLPAALSLHCIRSVCLQNLWELHTWGVALPTGSDSDPAQMTLAAWSVVKEQSIQFVLCSIILTQRRFIILLQNLLKPTYDGIWVCHQSRTYLNPHWTQYFHCYKYIHTYIHTGHH